MNQIARITRPTPSIPADECQPATQHSFARGLSNLSGVGFACLTVALATITFMVTIWGISTPGILHAEEQAGREHIRAVEGVKARHFQPAVVLEPKSNDRLPVFGGIRHVQ